MTEFYVSDRAYNLLGTFSTTSGKFDTTVAEDVQKIDESARTFQATINWAPSNIVGEIDELTDQAVSMFKEGNFVLYVDKQGKSVWTTIYEVNMDTEDGQADITCQDAGIDLINELVGPYVPDKQYTIAQYIERFTKDSGFEIGVNEIPKLSRKLQGWESTETALARIISVATQFDNAELDFSFEVQGLDVVKKYINIYKKRGGGDNTTLYVGKEINKIIVKSDIYSLATAIYPQGGTPEGKDTPVTLKGYKWTDPDKRFVLGNDGVLRDTVAVQKWSRLLSNENPNPTKSHIITRKDYETANQKTLLNNALRNLKEVNEPAVNYEVDIVELPDSVNIGDTINLVNERRELYLSARVLELTYDYCYGTGTAVLGDYLIQEGRIDTSLQDLANSLKERVDAMREEVKAKTKYIKSNTPPSEHENVIWIDTSKTPNIVKTWNESTQSWDKATPDLPGEVGAYPGDKGDVLEENVNVIHQDVEHVKGEIQDLGDDNKLTPVEKKAVALEIENIKATYKELVKQATKVDVDITDYGNKYKALLAYIQPLLDAVNVNSVIVPVTYKAKFTDYYSAEQNAKNLIGDKIIQLAEQGDENTQLVANTYTDSEIKKADKEIRLAVNQYTDVVVDKAKNEAKIHTAYANSPDGTVDFTREWPRENLYSPDILEKIYPSGPDGNIGFFENDFYHGYSLPVKAGEVYSFYRGDSGYRIRVLATKIKPVAGASSSKLGATELAYDLENPAVENIKVPSGYTYLFVVLAISSETGLTKDATLKAELGSTATPYLKDGDYMKYTGTSVKDSNNPTDYDWAKTSAKHTDVDQAVVIAKKYTDTSISLIPGQITAGVKESKEYADNAANGALAGSKSYTEAQIKIVKDSVTLKADKDGLIGLINVSPEKIKLNASKIDLNGKVTFSMFDSAAQKRVTDVTTTANNAKSKLDGWTKTGKTTIDGGKIETDSIKTASLIAGELEGMILTSNSGSGQFKVEGNHATFLDVDNGNRSELSDDGLLLYDRSNNLRARLTTDIINSHKFGTNYTNTYLVTGGIDSDDAQGGEVRSVLNTPAVENGTDTGAKTDYTYRPFRGNQLYTQKVTLNTAMPGNLLNMYLEVPYGGEVRIMGVADGANYRNLRANNVYVKSLMQRDNDDSNFYLGVSGTGRLRVTNKSGYNNGNPSYRDVQAKSFIGKLNQTSSFDKKQDIMLDNKSALDCINFADIYNYRYKDDVEEGNLMLRTGLIIGPGYHTPECIINTSRKTIDLYGMTSVAWKAIQELSKQNTDLQAQIDILKRGLIA